MRSLYPTIGSPHCRIRTLSLLFACGVFALSLLTAKPANAQIMQVTGDPAFPNSDLKQTPAPAVPNWERLGLQKTLAASYQRCGRDILEVSASTLGFKGALGGDYWDVPMPVHLNGMGSDCSNQLRAQQTGNVRDLRALFRGANDYILMWEKTWGKRKT